MRLLFCFPSILECSTVTGKTLTLGDFSEIKGNVWIARTGVGIPATFCYAQKVIEILRPSVVVLLGIAGIYPKVADKYPIGSVIGIKEERWGDLGLELEEHPFFKSIYECEWDSDFYHESFKCATTYQDLGLNTLIPLLNSLTVQSCTGNIKTADVRQNFGEIENMEGAALLQLTHRCGIPFYEIRSISNIAGNRKMEHKNILKALDELKIVFEKMIEKC